MQWIYLNGWMRRIGRGREKGWLTWVLIFFNPLSPGLIHWSMIHSWWHWLLIAGLGYFPWGFLGTPAEQLRWYFLEYLSLSLTRKYSLGWGAFCVFKAVFLLTGYSTPSPPPSTISILPKLHNSLLWTSSYIETPSAIEKDR